MKNIKEKKILRTEIPFDTNMNVKVEGNKIIISNGAKTIERKIISPIQISIEENKIIVSSKKSSKNEKKVYGSMNAHIKNMIKGLTLPFVYKLQVASVHFPITAKFEKENLKFIIKNFLGEKKDRVIEIVPGVDIKVDKEHIQVISEDIEKAGLVASRLEKGTKIRNRDRRVFQDGIFITEKPGKVFL